MNNDIVQEIQKFHHRIAISVRYDDLDTLRHVNNKAYLSYLEEARINYYADVTGFSPSTLEFGSVVARVDISYLYPIHYTNKVEAITRCPRVGNKSFDMETWVVVHTNEGIKISAKAMVTMVAVDNTGKSIPVPAHFVEKIKQFEA